MKKHRKSKKRANKRWMKNLLSEMIKNYEYN